jgi:hypothetical protein
MNDSGIDRIFATILVLALIAYATFAAIKWILS